MFCRAYRQPPVESSYPISLDALGLQLNCDGQFLEANAERESLDGNVEQAPVDNSPPNVTAAQSPRFFDYFHTSSERANEIRKEAAHTCARNEILQALQKLEIRQVFICPVSSCSKDDLSSSGASEAIAEVRPNGPHVDVLVSGGLEGLSKKKDVVVVVGESHQDLGVWAYRILLREGGIDRGSAVGLAKRLENWNEDLTGVRSGDGEIHVLPSPDDGVGKRPLHSSEDVAAKGKLEAEVDLRPGLVLLNPGQLLYSPSLNTNLSQTTWRARSTPSALDDPYGIHNWHNRVEGHRSPEQHVSTVLNSLPAWLRKDSRLCFIGIGDGAEVMLKFIDSVMGECTHQCLADKLDYPGPRAAQLKSSAAMTASTNFWSNHLKAVALCEPTHRHSVLQNKKFKEFLALNAKSWEVSSSTMGSTVATPSSDSAREQLPNSKISSPSADEEMYEHPPVSCPTFSAGPEVRIAECVFPTVLDCILDYFQSSIRRGEAEFEEGGS